MSEKLPKRLGRRELLAYAAAGGALLLLQSSVQGRERQHQEPTVEPAANPWTHETIVQFHRHVDSSSFARLGLPELLPSPITRKEVPVRLSSYIKGISGDRTTHHGVLLRDPLDYAIEYFVSLYAFEGPVCYESPGAILRRIFQEFSDQFGAVEVPEDSELLLTVPLLNRPSIEAKLVRVNPGSDAILKINEAGLRELGFDPSTGVLPQAVIASYSAITTGNPAELWPDIGHQPTEGSMAEKSAFQAMEQIVRNVYGRGGNYWDFIKLYGLISKARTGFRYAPGTDHNADIQKTLKVSGGSGIRSFTLQGEHRDIYADNRPVYGVARFDEDTFSARLIADLTGVVNNGAIIAHAATRVELTGTTATETRDLTIVHTKDKGLLAVVKMPDESQRIIKLKFRESPDAVINYLQVGTHGEILIATNDGIVVFDSDECKQIALQNKAELTPNSKRLFAGQDITSMALVDESLISTAAIEQQTERQFKTFLPALNTPTGASEAPATTLVVTRKSSNGSTTLLLTATAGELYDAPKQLFPMSGQNVRVLRSDIVGPGYIVKTDGVKLADDDVKLFTGILAFNFKPGLEQFIVWK